MSEISITGKVIQVGGDNPTVQLQLASGKFLTCKTDRVLAKELCANLYRMVKCGGSLAWDNHDEAVKITIDSVEAVQC